MYHIPQAGSVRVTTSGYYVLSIYIRRWEIERKLRLAKRSAAERGASPSEVARRRDARRRRRAQRRREKPRHEHNPQSQMRSPEPNVEQPEPAETREQRDSRGG